MVQTIGLLILAISRNDNASAQIQCRFMMSKSLVSIHLPRQDGKYLKEWITPFVGVF